MNIRTPIRLVALAAFVAVMLTGKVQIWLLLFAVTALASVLLSRIYCGYLCPISTVIDGFGLLTRRVDRRTSVAHPNVIRTIALIAFIGAIALVFVTGRRIPVLPALVVLGVAVSLIWGESTFHRVVCPFGTLQSLVRPRRSMGVGDKCVGCGKCVKACPSQAIELDGKATIDSKECLFCGRCADICPVDAISYGCKGDGTAQAEAREYP